jgi:hypothetical protein
MESVSNVSSEEELLQLLNDGKISHDEYEQLRQTLQKQSRTEYEPLSQNRLEPTRTSGLALASLIFSLIVPIGCIPAIICGHLALRRIEKQHAVRGRGLALAGTVIGYVVVGLSAILFLTLFLPLLAWRSAAISQPLTFEATELKRFPLDDMGGLITKTGVEIDKQISSDGNGSLRIEATERTTIRLFETGDMDIENARLIYQAKLRTENIDGQVYLEMWCHLPGLGDFFSRGLDRPLTGSTDWVTEETPFFLKEGENPDNVKLNLVINGKGTVWIDDIRLLKGPPMQ